MNVLIACEFSGIVREAFRKLGHNAWSVDLLPSEIPGQHLQHNIIDILENDIRFKGVPALNQWDLMIAHPPCTHLAVSGARWFKNKKNEQEEALIFVNKLMNANIPKICIENPISIISSKIRKPNQIIQPWMFGHGETKATCLWLKGLPNLIPTNIVSGRTHRVHTIKPSQDRWKERSRTYTGIAEAMAKQWGCDSP